MPQKLGGFKVLKNLCRFSVVGPEKFLHYDVTFLHSLAQEKINLSFITFAFSGGVFSGHILSEKSYCEKISTITRDNFESNIISQDENVILSLFPHRRNFNVLKELFRIFSMKNIRPIAFASSPSAISMVIRHEVLDAITSALFGPFVFGPYRTPSDWRLAQKGKEKLYKEVVASYQEKKPKTYGIELESANECLVIRMDENQLEGITNLLEELVKDGVPLTFVASVPSVEKNKENLLLSISGLSINEIRDVIGKNKIGIRTDFLGPVSILSMTGPHFGDRYGILSQLLTSLEEQNIEPIALSCTVASISCILNSGYEPEAIEAIKQRFEIPHVVNKAS